METTLEKIQSGKIRIESGRLFGLGMQHDESINIVKLDELITGCGKSGCIEVLSKTITSVAGTLSCNVEQENDEIKEFVSEWIIPELPDYREVNTLKKMIDVFNTYRL